MKRLILLLTAISTYGQYQEKPIVQFGISADVRNAVIGSKPTNNEPALDYILSANIVTPNHVIIGLGYESFKRIKFESFKFALGYRVPVTEWLSIPLTIEPHLIYRIHPVTLHKVYIDENGLPQSSNETFTVQRKDGYLAISYNAGLQFKVSEHFGVELTSCLMRRSDLKALYENNKLVLSNYAKIIYQL